MRKYRLLISHVSKDRDIALKCVAALERCAVVGSCDDCFKIEPIYMESETNGCFGDFVEWSAEAVLNSDGVLAIITDNTAETSVSDDGVEANVKVEYNEISFARTHKKDILVLRKQGVVLQSGFEFLLENIKYADFIGDDLDAAIACIVTDVILHAKRRFGGHPLLEYAGMTGTRLIPSVVEDASEYLGRADKLKEIDDCFEGGKHVVCITGFGGIGKTTLAKMYAKSHPEDPVVILYCSAEETSLKNAVVSLGMEFDSPEYGNMTVDERYALRIRQLSNLDERTLIVIDNFNADFGSVSNREVLTELSALDRCKFIISSRNTLKRSDIGVVPVGKLDDEELLELFYRDSHCDRNEQNDRYIKQLIVQTNGHTMTMELAAKAIGIDVNGVSLQEIADGLLSVDAVTNVEDRHDGFFEYETIYAHLRKLFNLSHITDAEKYLLGALSFVARRGLTIGELKDNVEYNVKDLIRLCALGYIAKSEGAVTTYSLHPLMSELAFMDFAQDIEQFKKIIDFLIFKKSKTTGNDTLADLDMRFDYAEHIYMRLSKLRKVSLCAQMNLAASYANLGDIVQAKGDIDGAEHYYVQGYEIAKEIADETGTIVSCRNLSISCNKLGNIAMAKGDIDRAEHYYVHGYKIRKEIVNEIGTIESRCDLSVSCSKLGEIAQAKGDIDEAEHYYMQDYELMKAIVNETGTIESRRGLSISCNKLGNIALARGDIDGAEHYYIQGYELAKEISDETGTIQSRRDLSISFIKLGDIALAKGDVDKAEQYYLQDYELSKAIADQTGTIESRRDLSISFNKLGNIARVKGDIDKARLYYIQDYELTKAIADETGTIEALDDLTVSYYKMSWVADSAEQIISHLNAALEIAQDLYNRHVDVNGRYKVLLQMLSDIYKKQYNIEEYEKMQNILKSLS